MQCHRRIRVGWLEKLDRKKREFQRREQEILDVTEHMLSGTDGESVTVEKIAMAVGIGKGTIYKHFRTKHEIISKLVEIRIQQRIDCLTPKDRTPLDRIRDYLNFRLSQPLQHQLVQRWTDSLVNYRQLDSLEQLRRMRDQERLKLAELLDLGGCTSESRSALTMAGWLLATVHGVLAFDATELNPERPEAMQTVVSQILLDLAHARREPRRVTVL